MNLKNICATFACMILCSCLSYYRAEHPIPPGIYVSEYGQEYVHVSASSLSFHIRLVSDKSAIFHSDDYLYKLTENGFIDMPLTAGEQVDRVGRFKWFWDGSEIVQENPNGGRLQFRKFNLDQIPANGKY